MLCCGKPTILQRHGAVQIANVVLRRLEQRKQYLEQRNTIREDQDFVFIIVPELE